jgi:hypothetical protein
VVFRKLSGFSNGVLGFICEFHVAQCFGVKSYIVIRTLSRQVWVNTEASGLI